MSGISKGSTNLQDTGGNKVEVEARSKSIKTITVEHNKIHEESHYFLRNYVSIASGTTYRFLLVMPASTPKIHFDWEIDFQLESTVEVKEGATVSANGTAITLFNSDRNSTNTSSMTAFHTPTDPAGGTIIIRGRKGDGQKLGGLVRAEYELVNKVNAKYLVEITNHGATASLTNYVFNLYEEA